MHSAIIAIYLNNKNVLSHLHQKLSRTVARVNPLPLLPLLCRDFKLILINEGFSQNLIKPTNFILAVPTPSVSHVKDIHHKLADSRIIGGSDAAVGEFPWQLYCNCIYILCLPSCFGQETAYRDSSAFESSCRLPACIPFVCRL